MKIFLLLYVLSPLFLLAESFENLTQNELGITEGTLVDDVDDDEPEDVERESPYSGMEICPYPPADTIDPCKCFVDVQFRIHLVCNIEQNMDEDILEKIVDSVGCRNEIYEFYVDLNDNEWTVDFDSNIFGRFKISKFKLVNISRVANIEAGAFNESMVSLKSFHIDNASDGPGSSYIGTGAFVTIQNVRRINLGNNFASIKEGAFRACSKLQEIVFSKQSLKKIQSEAFFGLHSLQKLDLSNQRLTELPSTLVQNLPNLTDVDLSSNEIVTVSENVFCDVPNLVNLDLSHNNICHIGNMLESLRNPDLVVNLRNAFKI